MAPRLAVLAVLWVCRLSASGRAPGAGDPRLRARRHGCGLLRLRGGRSPESMPGLAERRSRRSMGAPSSSSSELPLNAQAALASEAEASQATEASQGEDEQQTTEGTNESRGGTRIEDWEASNGSDGGDGGASGQSGEETSASSEFLMRLRRSSSPRGSLIATRIQRVLRRGGRRNASRSPAPPQERQDAERADGQEGRSESGGLGGSQQVWQLVFAGGTDDGEGGSPSAASSIFRSQGGCNLAHACYILEALRRLLLSRA